jgi:hypothetical protein
MARTRLSEMRASTEETMGVHGTHPNPTACAVRERTADGVSVGRCYFRTEEGVCPRHGNVSVVQAEYARTGRLTDEGDLYESRGQRPPWWGTKK